MERVSEEPSSLGFEVGCAEVEEMLRGESGIGKGDERSASAEDRDGDITIGDNVCPNCEVDVEGTRNVIGPRSTALDFDFALIFVDGS